MYTASDEHLITQIEHVLADCRPLGEIAPDLIRLISPADGAGHWSHVLVLLYLLESPRIFSALPTEKFPDDLGNVLEVRLKTSGLSLGFRPVGPLHIQTMQLRQRFESERRKYELVFGRLASGVAQVEAVRMLGAYMDTGSGPVFVEVFRSSYPVLFTAAEALRKDQLAQLSTDSELIELLRFEDKASNDEIAVRLRDRLQKVAARIKNPAALLARALRGDDVDQQLVAVGLVGYLRLPDLVPNLLELVLSDSSNCPQAAVIAAYLSSEMTRQMLSDLLADMMYGNPEDPDMVIDRAREITIVTARCVLPRIGSPLPRVEAGEIPSSVIPEKIDRLWNTWAVI